MKKTILIALFSTLLCISLSSQDRDPRVVYNGNRDLPMITLTVDDGWEPDWDLIAYLVEEEIPWCAFIPARIAASRPAWVTRMAELGVPVGCHGYTHHWLTRKTDDEIRQELQDSKDLLIELTGEFFPYFRPPSGQYDDRVIRIAEELGYTVVMWDNDALGYRENSQVADQFQYMMGHLKGGNIILTHFGERLNTLEVLKLFIPAAREAGYQFVSLPELLEARE